MIKVSVQAESLAVDNSVPPSYVVCAHHHINDQTFKTVHIILFCLVERIWDGINGIGGSNYSIECIRVTAYDFARIKPFFKELASMHLLVS